MRQDRPKPLYRKVNTRTHNVHHAQTAIDASWLRGKKPSARNEKAQKTIKQGVRHGLDYTPLFKFLLKKVGEPWSKVHQEATARILSEEPLWWMVARPGTEERRVIRTGESSYWSGLRLNADGILERVDPLLRLEDLHPNCPCCTHTFNGQFFVHEFDPNRGFFGRYSEATRAAD